ncbi:MULTISPECIES: hypothetical protein [unclassified Helicobacter]|uniref:hypothetical protein n=1 Tax=unclassified Helicobacter TaxID=2593540 RepID=UPI00115FB8BB|nr:MULTISPECIES: hypothetical protein [unclassified Helicobacter]
MKRFFAPFAKSKKSRAQNEIQNLAQNPKQNLEQNPAQHAVQDSKLESAKTQTPKSELEFEAESKAESKLDSTQAPAPKLAQDSAPNIAPNHTSNEHFIQAIKSRIEREKSLFPYEMLGRSLSYNPYPPRFKELFPALESARAICVKGFDFAKLEQIVAQEADIIVLDLARGADGAPSGEGLECVGYLRHYTGALIVLRDCFVDAYQVLQAVAYGADGVILDSRGAGLKECVARAFSLGLMAFVEVRDARDVKNGVLAKAEGFYLPGDVFDELCSIVPKRKCICTDLDSRLESGLDASFDAGSGLDSGKSSELDSSSSLSFGALDSSLDSSKADLDSHALDSRLSLESKADFAFVSIALESR